MTEVKDHFGAFLHGWVPDAPDHRDRCAVEYLARSGAPVPSNSEQNQDTDLGEFLPPSRAATQHSGPAACACVVAIEYLNRRCFQVGVRLSAAFLHRVTERMQRMPAGTAGTSLRVTLKAAKRLGIPPAFLEQEGADPAADPLLYAFHEYRALEYYRIDSHRMTGTRRLQVVQHALRRGLPILFGMSLPSVGDDDGRFDDCGDAVPCGSTVGVMVGYDSEYAMSSRGAIKFLSVRGEGWGDRGFGYINRRLFTRAAPTHDMWVVTGGPWQRSGELPDVEC